MSYALILDCVIVTFDFAIQIINTYFTEYCMMFLSLLWRRGQPNRFEFLLGFYCAKIRLGNYFVSIEEIYIIVKVDIAGLCGCLGSVGILSQY